MRADSWEEPGSVGVNGQYEGYVERSATLPGVTGCDLLAFDPSIEVQPDTLLADEPVGLGVNVKVPQPEKPEALATPHLRDAVVTLPEGMSISPGVVDGIQACNETGPEGINFTGPESEEVGLERRTAARAGALPGRVDRRDRGSDHAAAGRTGQGPRVSRAPGVRRRGAGCVHRTRTRSTGNLYQLYLELGGDGRARGRGDQHQGARVTSRRTPRRGS